MRGRTNRRLLAAALAVLILGAILSRVVEPRVRVKKVTLFRYGEALAATGFISYSVDQPDWNRLEAIPSLS